MDGRILPAYIRGPRLFLSTHAFSTLQLRIDMAKKRKGGPRQDDAVDDTSTKRVRMNINSYEDVAGSDDEFHLNRDEVRLGETADEKRRRKWQEQGMCDRRC